MKNKVFLGDDGFMHVDWIGDQVHPDIIQISEEIRELASKIKKEGKPVLMLVNLENLGTPDVRSMTQTREEIQTFGMDKMAVYGIHNKFVENVVGVVVNQAELLGKIKYFKSREDAVEWLSE
jgi:hypothetical protein